MSNNVSVRFARKPCDLNEVKASLRSSEVRTYECEIEETAELSTEEYDAFTRLMYKNCHWLEGRGGFKKDVRQVVAVSAPERETLYVDPSGYSYARYVGIKAEGEQP